MQIHYKSLSVEVLPPRYAPRSDEFKANYPLGKVPTLELDDGRMIGESTAIMHYLEALFPARPMQPKEPFEAAQNEMLIRYVDNHLATALSPLFKVFFGRVHGTVDDNEQASKQDLSALNDELAKLNTFLTTLGTHNDRSLYTGDLCLASNLYYVEQLSLYFGEPQILNNYAEIRAWKQWVEQYPAVAESLIQMHNSHTALLAKLNASKTD